MKKLLKLSESIARLEAAVRGASTVPLHELDQSLTTVASAYALFGLELPIDNAWRFGKLKDSAGACQGVDSLAASLLLSPKLHRLLLIAAFSADIGRLVIALEHQKGDKTRTQVDHGAASTEVLANLLVLEAWGDLASALGTAVTWHSQVTTPTSAEIDDPVSWTLCCVLRDLDMSTLVAGKGSAYVDNPAEIKRQLVANKLKPFEAEGGMDIKENILAQFERGEPIDRLTCHTYPEFLLQFLAWRANFTFEETWDVAVKSDGYNAVLRWFEKTLSPYGTKLQRVLAAAYTVYGLKW